MEFVRNIFLEYGQLIIAPFLEPEMLWIVTPLFIMMFVLNSYFASHLEEKLGWNTAISNSTLLFFIGIDLFRNIYNYTSPATFGNFFDHPYKVIVILFIMMEGIVLSYSAFKHILPEKIMFFAASHVTINVQAYVLIVLVYLRVDPTIYTIFATLLLFATLLAVFWYFSYIIKKHLAYNRLSVIPPIAKDTIISQ